MTTKTLVVNLKSGWSGLAFLLAIPIPVVLFVVFSKPGMFSYWGQPDFLTLENKLLLVLSVSSFLGVFWLGLPASTGLVEVEVSSNLSLKITNLTTLFARVTFCAYGIWLVAGLARGLSVNNVLDVLGGQNDTVWVLKNVILAPVSGITTWVQLGPIAAVLAVLRWRTSGKSPKRLLVALIAVSGVRALLFSERLALLEVAIAAGLAWISTSQNPPKAISRWQNWIFSWLVGIVALVAVFVAFEFFRSWTTYSKTDTTGIFFFGALRVLGYYATAINNGALFLKVNSDVFDPLALLQGAFGIPGLQEFLANNGQGSNQNFFQALRLGSDPEFNNVSGFLLTTSTLGLLLSVFFWVLCALGLVALSARALRGSVTSLVLLCCSMVGVVESVRLLYWTQSRFTPILLATLFISIYLSKDSSRTKKPT